MQYAEIYLQLCESAHEINMLLRNKRTYYWQHA